MGSGPPRRAPELRRTWLFGPGADAAAHAAMLGSGADALIIDPEDFTPPERRAEARALLPGVASRCRRQHGVFAIRINHLDHADGPADLAAAMAPPARPPTRGAWATAARAWCAPNMPAR